MLIESLLGRGAAACTSGTLLASTARVSAALRNCFTSTFCTCPTNVAASLAGSVWFAGASHPWLCPQPPWIGVSSRSALSYRDSYTKQFASRQGWHLQLPTLAPQASTSQWPGLNWRHFSHLLLVRAQEQAARHAGEGIGAEACSAEPKVIVGYLATVAVPSTASTGRPVPAAQLPATAYLAINQSSSLPFGGLQFGFLSIWGLTRWLSQTNATQIPQQNAG